MVQEILDPPKKKSQERILNSTKLESLKAVDIKRDANEAKRDRIAKGLGEIMISMIPLPSL